MLQREHAMLNLERAAASFSCLLLFLLLLLLFTFFFPTTFSRRGFWGMRLWVDGPELCIFMSTLRGFSMPMLKC